MSARRRRGNLLLEDAERGCAVARMSPMRQSRARRHWANPVGSIGHVLKAFTGTKGSKRSHARATDFGMRQNRQDARKPRKK